VVGRKQGETNAPGEVVVQVRATGRAASSSAQAPGRGSGNSGAHPRRRWSLHPKSHPLQPSWHRGCTAVLIRSNAPTGFSAFCQLRVLMQGSRTCRCHSLKSMAFGCQRASATLGRAAAVKLSLSERDDMLPLVRGRGWTRRTNLVLGSSTCTKETGFEWISERSGRNSVS
jgi:hypothetical protein